jgi:hypothetical protein
VSACDLSPAVRRKLYVLLGLKVHPAGYTGGLDFGVMNWHPDHNTWDELLKRIKVRQVIEKLK